MEEISGVAFIFNQKFFLDLKEETGKREAQTNEKMNYTLVGLSQSLQMTSYNIMNHSNTVSFVAGIDLENIVYYRDNTHYFVMTAKKQSLLDKGVVINVSRTL